MTWAGIGRACRAVAEAVVIAAFLTTLVGACEVGVAAFQGDRHAQIN